MQWYAMAGFIAVLYTLPFGGMLLSTSLPLFLLTIILFNMDDHFYDLFYNVHKAVESGVRPRAVCTAHEELEIQLSVPCLLYQ